ncbi:glutamine synthetase family protein [Streptomyces sp. NBC_00820]|uniref:glutamine synthetase family protein n=1 Tax=Streptomyces sp. NBC_00820 TaxID=2975842 RepID=UPI002ED1799B|nr:glutamine synthetase family protein [Streptomyces sp. NBC_00820]
MAAERFDATQAQQAVEKLSGQGVRAVAVSWVDNAGISRVKGVPLHRLPEAAEWGIGMAPVFDTFLVDDSHAESPSRSGPVGDLRLMPDLDRLTPLAAQPGWAWAPADRHTQDGTVHPGCQRSFAARQTRQATDAGLGIRMGFETEWTVAPERPRSGEGAALGQAPDPGGAPAYGMTRLLEADAYLLAVCDALTAQDIDVLQIHPEYAAGQFEVSTAAEDPLGAADSAVLVRHTVRAASLRHGLRPSFAPLTDLAGTGNGGHLHLSVWADGRNLLQGGEGPRGMTRTGEAFLAGILEALPALTAIGCPTPASYLRLAPSRWAGAYQCWGWENREAAVRFVTGMPHQRGTAANAEVKCFDLAANPYLVVGSVIAAGLAGVGAGLRLPPEFTSDPATASAETLAEGGVRRLPSTLPEAIGHYEASRTLRRAMGDGLFEAVLAVRRAEAALFDGQSPEEVVRATRWRY